MSESSPNDRRYDLYSQSTKNDPYPVFDRIRQDEPVFAQPGIDGQTMIWFLTRYDDVELLLRDDARFVRDPRHALPPEQIEPLDDLQVLLNNYMLNKDGAGHETTVNLIGNAALALLRQPETRQILAQDDNLMEAAVEEFLRYDSPVERALVRWVAQDTVLGGQQIKRGDLVIGVVGSANRDPKQFAEPERLDLHRGSQRHLACGHGAHYCLGAPLARLEGEIALGTLLRRLPNLRLSAPECELAWHTVPIFRGLMALPVTWMYANSAAAQG